MRLRFGAPSAENDRLRCSRVTLSSCASAEVRTGRPACDTTKRHASRWRGASSPSTRGGVSSAFAKRVEKLVLRDDVPRGDVVDAIHQHIGEFEARALCKRGSFSRAKRRQPEKRRAWKLARQRRDSPRLFVCAPDVHDRGVDEILPKGDLEILERLREDDAHTPSRKRRSHQRSRAFAMSVDDDRRQATCRWRRYGCGCRRSSLRHQAPRAATSGSSVGRPSTN